MTKIVSFLPVLLPKSGGCATYSEVLMMEGFGARPDIDHVVITEYSGKVFFRRYSSLIFAVLPPRRSRQSMGFLYSALSFIVSRLISALCYVTLRIVGYRRFHLHSSVAYSFDLMLLKSLGCFVTLDVRDRYARPSVLRWSTSCIACSEEIAADIRLATSAPRVFYLPIPVDFSEIKACTERVVSSAKRVDCGSVLDILYCGVVSRDKGVEVLIAGFLQAFDEDSGRTLTIAGPLQDPSILEGLPSHVKYIGVLDRKRALASIDNARLLVVLGGFEGIPRVAIEAISLQTPVILPPGISLFQDQCAGSVLPALTVEQVFQFLNQPVGNFEVKSLDLEQFDSKSIAEKTIEVLIDG